MIISCDTKTGEVTKRDLTPEEVAERESLEPVQSAPKQVTSLEFLDLFHEAEQLAIATAAVQSARTYVNRHRFGWGVAYRIINLLFFWQENHCRDSYQADVDFAKEVLNV